MMDAAIDFGSLLFDYDPSNDPLFNLNGSEDSETIPSLPLCPSLLPTSSLTVPDTVAGPFLEGTAKVTANTEVPGKLATMPTPEASSQDSHSNNENSPMTPIHPASQANLDLQQQLQVQSSLHALLMRVQVLEQYQHSQEMILKQQQANLASIWSEFQAFSSQTKDFAEQIAAKVQTFTSAFPQQQFSNQMQTSSSLMGPPKKPEPIPKRRKVTGKSTSASNENARPNVSAASPNPSTTSTQTSYIVDPKVENEFLEKLRTHSQLKRSMYIRYNNNPPKEVMTPIIEGFNSLWGSFTLEQKEYLKTKIPQPPLSMQPPQAPAQMGFYSGANMSSQAPPAHMVSHPQMTMQPPPRPPLAPMASHQLNPEVPGGYIHFRQSTDPQPQSQSPAAQAFGTPNHQFMVPPSPHINMGFPTSSQSMPQQMVPPSTQVYAHNLNGSGFPGFGQSIPQHMQNSQILMQTPNLYPQRAPQQNYQAMVSSPSNLSIPSQWQQIDPNLATTTTMQQVPNRFVPSPPNQLAQPYTPQANYCAISAPPTPQGYASTPSTPAEYIKSTQKVSGAPGTAPKPARRTKRKAAEKSSE